MFTLKFIADSRCNGEVEGNIVHVISASSYEVYTRNNGIISITTINPDGIGMDFYITPTRINNEYQECFVENSKGKTIARYTSGLSLEQYQELLIKRNMKTI